MQFHFYVSDAGGSIILRERLPSGALARAEFARVWVGETFRGVTYEAMHKIGSGMIEADDNGNGRIL